MILCIIIGCDDVTRRCTRRETGLTCRRGCSWHWRRQAISPAAAAGDRTAKVSWHVRQVQRGRKWREKKIRRKATEISTWVLRSRTRRDRVSYIRIGFIIILVEQSGGTHTVETRHWRRRHFRVRSRPYHMDGLQIVLMKEESSWTPRGWRSLVPRASTESKK